MRKKHIFLRVFSKITILVCVFCAFSAWAETTTCDINYTPVTGNSIQNGTPTPTSPVEIKSIGTKVGNKYAVQVAVNYDSGVVDLGTLDYSKYNTTSEGTSFIVSVETIGGKTNGGCTDVEGFTRENSVTHAETFGFGVNVAFRTKKATTVAELKTMMSGVMLYYQRATDETWTAPTLKTVYLDEPLRKVGDYADVLDYKNGTITRNVGVKVLDGTENWTGTSKRFSLTINDTLEGSGDWAVACSHYRGFSGASGYSGMPDLSCKINLQTKILLVKDEQYDYDTTIYKAWLAAQYAAGTPVTVYYPLATPVVEQIENWSCPVPITDIQIATTKMVDDEFAQAEANLAATVQTIESVVSRTIAQTGQIATLHETKQTRPDESCPANMKCLLVQDEDGTPHWYPIIEP